VCEVGHELLPFLEAQFVQHVGDACPPSVGRLRFQETAGPGQAAMILLASTSRRAASAGSNAASRDMKNPNGARSSGSVARRTSDRTIPIVAVLALGSATGADRQWSCRR
jgi:hypothetical protein